MKVPNFIVAGTQKAATTWLHECLNEHPEVFVPKVKEIHFFCKEPCRKSTNNLGTDWYISQFPDNKSFKAIGEITVDYMYYEHIAKEIYNFNPNMKILFILRNPVDRAYSAYWMNKRQKSNMPEFQEFIRVNHEFIDRGFYYNQIERYFEFFKENIKIFIYEDLLRNPEAFIKEVYSFLNVDDDFIPQSLYYKVASTRKKLGPVFGKVLYRYLAPILKRSSLLTYLWRAVKYNTPVKRLFFFNKENASKYNTFNTNDRECLLEIYKKENKKLFDLIGRNIDEWDN